MNVLKQIAEALDGSEYPLEIEHEIEVLAQRENIVIVFGNSDDLIEFCGAIEDEATVSDGSIVQIDQKGVIPIKSSGKFGSSHHGLTVEGARELVMRFDNAIHVTAHWCPDSVQGVSWLYELHWNFNDKIDQETFDVMEDGRLYCKGIVFQLPQNKIYYGHLPYSTRSL